MVARKKYEAALKGFLDRWERQKMISPTISKDLGDLWLWVKGSDGAKGVEETKLYLKQGANIMRRFVDHYKAEDSSLRDMLVKCSYAVLKGDEKVCSKRTRDELNALIKDYNSFVSEMIGCHDQSLDYMLALLKRSSDILGPEYKKIKDDLEVSCMDLGVKRLR